MGLNSYDPERFQERTSLHAAAISRPACLLKSIRVSASRGSLQPSTLQKAFAGHPGSAKTRYGFGAQCIRMLGVTILPSTLISQGLERMPTAHSDSLVAVSALSANLYIGAPPDDNYAANR